MLDAARAAPARGRELREAAAQLDVPWARSWLAGFVRENFLRFVLNPLMDYYAARRASGKEKLEGVKGPVILVANHASHMDTPVILSALPRRLRKRTVAAARRRTAATSTSCWTRGGTCCSTPRARAPAAACRVRSAAARPCSRRHTT